jgi:hypothetical protein
MALAKTSAQPTFRFSLDPAVEAHSSSASFVIVQRAAYAAHVSNRLCASGSLGHPQSSSAIGIQRPFPPDHARGFFGTIDPRLLTLDRSQCSHVHAGNDVASPARGYHSLEEEPSGGLGGSALTLDEDRDLPYSNKPGRSRRKLDTKTWQSEASGRMTVTRLQKEQALSDCGVPYVAGLVAKEQAGLRQAVDTFEAIALGTQTEATSGWECTTCPRVWPSASALK